MTEKLVDIIGTTVSITGEGRPVGVVHGVFMDRRMWFPQVEVLSRDYTVCCMDMLGHGYAPDPDGEKKGYWGRLWAAIKGVGGSGGAAKVEKVWGFTFVD